ncbi:hypothetical protein [Sporosarcina sp. USHLN248]|uniref:hypothetical protein n=1 Tax=Sporosarcina sp. USHLN248 TaxID=3081300 RepID=UPI003019722A
MYKERKGLTINMALANQLSGMFLVPASLLLVTLEIVLESYRVSAPKWTARLAIGNLFINISWAFLIFVMLMNPQLLQPHIAHFFSEIFQQSSEDLLGRVEWIFTILGIAAIIVMLIDAVSGFTNLRTGK